MATSDNRYAQAAQDDYQTLKDKWNAMRDRMKSDEKSDTESQSELAETAWADFKEQSEKLQAAGSTASDELRGSYEASREKLHRVMDSYNRA